MSGRVQSNLARTKRTLPEGSLYIPINDDYQRRVGHSQEDSMPGEAFAKSVVASILKPKPKAWIWEGTSSWSVWAMDSFLPRGSMVSKRIFPVSSARDSTELAIGRIQRTCATSVPWGKVLGIPERDLRALTRSNRIPSSQICSTSISLRLCRRRLANYISLGLMMRPGEARAKKLVWIRVMMVGSHCCGKAFR